MGRMMNRLLQNAVMLGGVITAYQAAQTTKKENGKITVDKFVGNFRSQAAQNIRTVAGAAKPLAGKYFGLFTAKTDKKTKAPENETARNIYETAKAVAPDAVEKVEEYVEDVRENAPEYKAQAEKAIDDAAESAIEYLDLEDKPKEAKPAEEPKPAARKKAAAPRKSAPRKSAAAKKADDASAEPKRKRAPRAKKTAETTETTEENK